MTTPSVMHVEVGGTYGGSLRALELYLQHCDPSRLRHHLLLYYPVEGMERLRPLVGSLTVLCPQGPRRQPRLTSPPGLRGQSRPQVLQAVAPWLHLTADMPLAFGLTRLLRASGCDLVHCNNTFTYQPATLLASRWAGLPVAAHVRNPLPGGRFQHWLARQVQLFLPLHRGQQDTLQQWQVSGPIACCSDGVVLPAPHAERVAALRRELLPSGGVLIGSLGRLDPQKGYDLLLAAAARVFAQFPSARMVIFGEGSERASLTAAITRFGVEGRVLLPGFAPHPADALAALDLFVCSSRWEGVPLAVLEAMLAGIPVVATTNALAGEPRLLPLLAAPPASPEAASMSAAIAYALRHRAMAQAQAPRARAWVQAEFAPEPAAARLDSALFQATAAAARPVRTFYESAYQQPRWQPSESGRPASRFTKMWYQATERHVLPKMDLYGRRVLEVGCGYGWLAPRICAAGGRYVGVELAESALRQFPRTLASCSPVQGDACHLPFAADSFDAVFCLEVLEHIPRQQELLSEIFRVAAPGATVVLTTPSYCNCYLPLKLLADAGVHSCRRYLTHQPVDHLQFAFRLHALLAGYGAIIEQRAIRLHPPLAERLDDRFGCGQGPARVNDWLFALERRYGAAFPWRYFGLHTCFVMHAAGPTL